MSKSKKEIIKRLEKTCACCGEKIKPILYKDRKYRNGHYFGKIPLCTDRAIEEAAKFDFKKWKQPTGSVWYVYKKDPKPYEYAEYWECPTCYWHGKNTKIPSKKE